MTASLGTGTVVGRYRVLEHIATHACAALYLARANDASTVLVVASPHHLDGAWPRADATLRYEDEDVAVFEALTPELESALRSIGIDPRGWFTTLSPTQPGRESPTTRCDLLPYRAVAAPEPARPPRALLTLVDAPGSLRVSPPAARGDEPLPPLDARFLLRRKLGEGGFGEVFEAFDTMRHSVVAVKRLRRWDGARLRRFKHEFRQISSLRHPHLVKCYELFQLGDEAYFSMELIDGFSLQHWLRKMDCATTAIVAGDPRRDDEDCITETTAETRNIDADAIRRVVFELAQALAFLHSSGKLHRDIKPSNIMIDAGGRTVLLDFGLVLDHEREHDPEVLMGTPRYLAPEQLRNEPLCPAVDLYQLGLVVFELLVGTSPWPGRASDSFGQRLSADGPRPSEYARGVPPDLDDLVASLLRRDPALRPSAADVAARMGALPPPTPRSGTEPAMVGRNEELRSLEAALRSVAPDKMVVVLVEGHSGMGKSALINTLGQRVADAGDAILLSGRCFEWESVPFNGFDAISDAFIAALHRFSASESAAIVGDDVEAVARLFPAFAELISPTHAGVPEVLSSEVRRNALRGYRAMLRRLCERRPVVLTIDDLQWGDADSAAILLELMQPRDRPPLAIVLAARHCDTPSPCVQVFRRFASNPPPGLELVHLPLGPLSEADARELCLAVAGDMQASLLDEVVRETKGQPFFIAELVRRLDRGIRRASLDDLLRSRADELTACGRRLLEVLALIARPVVRRVAEEASNAAAHGSLSDAWAELSMGRWVKATKQGYAELVECYHDRIRESIASTLDESERRRRHGTVAQALERHQPTSTEAIATHFAAAGKTERAYPYMVEAARAAQQAMAFEHAARLFGIAAEMAADPTDRRSHRLERAKALAMAGHGKEAAEIYLDIARCNPAESTLELRRLAAEQLVSTGHVRQGIDVLNAVLRELGIDVPRTRFGVAAAHLWQSFWMFVRGLRVHEPSTPAPPSDLAVIDCMRVLGALMSLVNPLMSGYFVRRHVVLALRSGEPHRVAQAFAEEGMYAAVHGGEMLGVHEARLFAEAERRASQSGDDELLTQIHVLQGVAHICHSNWRSARCVLEAAEKRLVERHPGLTWELNQARLYRLFAMRCLGHWQEVASAAKGLIDDASNRKDRYAEATYRTFWGDIQALLDDDPAAAIETMQTALERWEVLDYDIIRVTAHEGICNAVLYREGGVGTEALAHVRGFWRGMKRSGTWFVQVNRVVWQDILGRTCVAAAAQASGSAKRRLLREATRVAAALGRSRIDSGRGCAERLHACIAIARGHTAEAMARLLRAEVCFGRAEMHLMQAAVRWRYGQLLGGDEGTRLALEQLHVAEREGAKNPSALLASMVPGRWE